MLSSEFRRAFLCPSSLRFIPFTVVVPSHHITAYLPRPIRVKRYANTQGISRGRLEVYRSHQGNTNAVPRAESAASGEKKSGRGFVSSNVIVDCAEAFRAQPHSRPEAGFVTEHIEKKWSNRDSGLCTWRGNPGFGRLRPSNHLE
jgi:hypothetical protein